MLEDICCGVSDFWLGRLKDRMAVLLIIGVLLTTIYILHVSGIKALDLFQRDKYNGLGD